MTCAYAKARAVLQLSLGQGLHIVLVQTLIASLIGPNQNESLKRCARNLELSRIRRNPHEYKRENQSVS